MTIAVDWDVKQQKQTKQNFCLLLFQTSRTKTEHERRKEGKKVAEKEEKDIPISFQARGAGPRGISGEEKGK